MGQTLEQPRVIRTPKPYWVNKRVHSHRNWEFAFWRELFQNSVDARAKNIDISLNEADGKGSWGRAPNDDRVVRVRFQDDGMGMTRDVLENVFFAPGESTKRNGEDNVGGFGTARTMLCFSQSRYSIQTGESQVEGDGSEYTIDDGPKVKGTIFEIDLSARETSTYSMRESLERYLSMSQLNVNIRLNGETVEAKTKKGPARRQLVATVTERAADGTKIRAERAFATVHANQGEKSPHKGKIIVRVNGATMFVDNSSIPHQVVVELDPERSREVLTDNRDGMKWDFQNALNNFIEEIAQDQRSALKEKDSETHRVIAGGLGSHLVEANLTVPLGAVDYTPAPDVLERETALVPVSALRSFEPTHFEEKGFVGVPAFGLRELIERLKDGRPTFLDNWNNVDEVKAFREGARGDLAACLGKLSDDFGRFLAAGVGASLRSAGLDPKYADMHDVHLYIEEDNRNPKEMTEQEREERKKWTWAVYRWSPDYWKKKGQTQGDGRGKSANLMLAAWTTMCEHAVRALLDIQPNLNEGEGIRFATGFAFVRDKQEYNYDLGKTVPKGVGALHTKKGDVEVLLINPITSDGKEAYDLKTEGAKPGGKKGLSDMAALAVHEVAHILRSRHDEEYASVLTRITAAFYHPERQRKMRADLVRNMAAVSAAYGGGIAQIQAMDAPEEIPLDNIVGRRRKARPAEKLQAIANPGITAVLGTVATPDNAQAAPTEVPALLEYIEKTVRLEKGGVTVVDCEARTVLEERIAETLAERAMEISGPAPERIEEEARIPEKETAPILSQDIGLTALDPASLVSDVKPERNEAQPEPAVETVVAKPAEVKSLLSDLSLGRFSETRDVGVGTVNNAAPKVNPFEALKKSGSMLGSLAERIKQANAAKAAETAAKQEPNAAEQTTTTTPAISVDDVGLDEFKI